MPEFKNMEMEDLKEERLNTDIHTIKNALTTLGLKVELVYAALTGNEISKDEGLVGEIKQQKESIRKLSERVDKVEKNESKRQVYVTIIWAAIGFILAMLFNHFWK